MTVFDPTILGKALDWLSVILTGGIVFVLRRIFQHDARLSLHEKEIALCAQRDELNAKQREEDIVLRDQQRKEVLRRIDNHHEKVMDRLDKIVDTG